MLLWKSRSLRARPKFSSLHGKSVRLIKPVVKCLLIHNHQFGTNSVYWNIYSETSPFNDISSSQSFWTLGYLEFFRFKFVNRLFISFIGIFLHMQTQTYTTSHSLMIGRTWNVSCMEYTCSNSYNQFSSSKMASGNLLVVLEMFKPLIKWGRHG